MLMFLATIKNAKSKKNQSEESSNNRGKVAENYGLKLLLAILL